MGRKPSYDDYGTKKGAWSPEEDKKLSDYILRYGHWNWRELPRFAGLARCGKSCRLRWMNYLRPNVKRGSYTEEEEDIIIKSHEELGNKWSAIAAKLPGRTDNEIKNHWHTHLKKRLNQNQSTKQSTDRVQSVSNRRRKFAPKDHVADQDLDLSQPPPILESSSSSSEISNLSCEGALFCGMNSVMEDISSTPLPYLEPIVEISIDDFWTQPFLADTVFDYQSGDLFSPLGEGGFLSPYDLCYDDVWL